MFSKGQAIAMIPKIGKLDYFKSRHFCPDLLRSSFWILDPILNPDHLQANLFLDIQIWTCPDIRSPQYSDAFTSFKPDSKKPSIQMFLIFRCVVLGSPLHNQIYVHNDIFAGDIS